MNKFDIQPERASAEAKEKFLHHLDWMPLREQAAAVSQPALFAFSAPPAPDIPESTCDHVGAGRETQLRLDGGTSQLCTRCNNVVDDSAEAHS